MLVRFWSCCVGALAVLVVGWLVTLVFVAVAVAFGLGWWRLAVVWCGVVLAECCCCGCCVVALMVGQVRHSALTLQVGTHFALLMQTPGPTQKSSASNASCAAASPEVQHCVCCSCGLGMATSLGTREVAAGAVAAAAFACAYQAYHFLGDKNDKKVAAVAGGASSVTEGKQMLREPQGVAGSARAASPAEFILASIDASTTATSAYFLPPPGLAPPKHQKMVAAAAVAQTTLQEAQLFRGPSGSRSHAKPNAATTAATAAAATATLDAAQLAFCRTAFMERRASIRQEEFDWRQYFERQWPDLRAVSCHVEAFEEEVACGTCSGTSPRVDFVFELHDGRFARHSPRTAANSTGLMFGLLSAWRADVPPDGAVATVAPPSGIDCIDTSISPPAHIVTIEVCDDVSLQQEFCPRATAATVLAAAHALLSEAGLSTIDLTDGRRFAWWRWVSHLPAHIRALVVGPGIVRFVARRLNATSTATAFVVRRVDGTDVAVHPCGFGFGVQVTSARAPFQALEVAQPPLAPSQEDWEVQRVPSQGQGSQARQGHLRPAYPSATLGQRRYRRRAPAGGGSAFYMR